jgi:histidyl-tRNA synthetase
MKSQMKAADRSGAKVAVIVGQDEVSAGTCVVRRLDSSDQVVIPRADLVDYLGSIGLKPSTETA